MKKAIFAVLLVGLFALAGLAGEVMTVKGIIIDNMCANANSDNLAEFIKTHTKQCALMPNCVASGYSLFTEGKLHKFDQASNKKIEEFLRKVESRLEVVVKVEKVGEELKLVSIENQK